MVELCQQTCWWTDGSSYRGPKRSASAWELWEQANPWQQQSFQDQFECPLLIRHVPGTGPSSGRKNTLKAWVLNRPLVISGIHALAVLGTVKCCLLPRWCRPCRRDTLPTAIREVPFPWGVRMKLGHLMRPENRQCEEVGTYLWSIHCSKPCNRHKIWWSHLSW